MWIPAIAARSAVSLVIWGFILSCGNDVGAVEISVKDYKHSGDFTEQLIMVSDKVGLVKFTKEKSGETSFSLVEAHWGGEPELPSASGYLIDKWLVTGIRRISISPKDGKWVLDTGIDTSYEPQYALVDPETTMTQKSSQIDQLPIHVDEANRVWWSASIFFDKHLVAFLASEKTTTPPK